MTMFSCHGSGVTVLWLCLVSLTDIPALQRVSRRETTEESSGRSLAVGREVLWDWQLAQTHSRWQKVQCDSLTGPKSSWSLCLAEKHFNILLILQPSRLFGRTDG